MNVKIKPVGIIRNYTSEAILTVTEGDSALDVLGFLNIPMELRPIVFVNNKRVPLNQKVLNDDEIKIVSLVMGG